MGNSMTQYDINLGTNYINQIKNLDFPILDIGTRNGTTAYLDIIEPEELGSNNIMKGTDSNLRPFIVFKAEFVYPNGLKKKTFTTFFQRYNDDSLLWMCCGHYGVPLMITTGGTNNEQYKLLYELFSTSEYKINKNIIFVQGLNFKYDDNLSDDELTDDDYPVNIVLGHSD